VTTLGWWQARRAALLIFMVVLGAALFGFYLAFSFAESERKRDLLAWQKQLSVVMQSRLVAVEDWVGQQQKVVTDLAENGSLQIYLTEISYGVVQDDVTGGAAQLGYLENMLNVVAQQNGFAAAQGRADVPVNIDRPAVAGIVLTSPEGDVMVATPNMPIIAREILRDYQRQIQQGLEKRNFFGPFVGEDGRAAVAVIAPIAAIQPLDEGGAIGYAIGVRPLGDDLFDRLRQPGEISHSARTYLVRQRGAAIEYLSPLSYAGGIHAPLQFSLSADTPSLAAAKLLKKPGSFQQATAFDGRKVLATGRQVGGTDWLMVRTIDAREALGAISQRRNMILTISSLLILLVSGAVLLVWRHGASVRVAAAAERYRHLAEKLEKVYGFLKVVTDCQPTSIAAVDSQGHYTFANRQTAADVGMPAQDMIGRAMRDLLGAEKATPLEEANAAAVESGQPIMRMRSVEHSGRQRMIKSDHIPLDKNQEGMTDHGVLMVMEDITELVSEREKREQNLRHLVTTLATIIDSRDPFSTHHSKRVAEVAETIAEEMGLKDQDVETAEIAGALMNLGKIMVPRSVLTKPETLSTSELTVVRENLAKTAEMLKGIIFDGPVLQTIRQVHAHWDGSGMPEGLKGEDILMTARIVAVANAYVGMTCARAYRPGMPIDEAMVLLLKDVDKRYDRGPVAALLNYLDNKGGRARWQHFADPAA